MSNLTVKLFPHGPKAHMLLIGNCEILFYSFHPVAGYGPDSQYFRLTLHEGSIAKDKHAMEELERLLSLYLASSTHKILDKEAFTTHVVSILANGVDTYMANMIYSEKEETDGQAQEPANPSDPS